MQTNAGHIEHVSTETSKFIQSIFTVRRCPSVCPSVRHKPVLYQNG